MKSLQLLLAAAALKAAMTVSTHAGLPDTASGFQADALQSTSTKARDLQGSFQLAGIGNDFDFLTPNHKNNKLIQDSDEIILGVLRNLWAAEEQFLREEGLTQQKFGINELPSDFGEIYESYGRHMKELSGRYGKGPYDHSDPSRLDICKSIATHDFLTYYHKKLSDFIVQNYVDAGHIDAQMQQLEILLQELKKENDAESERLKTAPLTPGSMRKGCVPVVS